MVVSQLSGSFEKKTKVQKRTTNPVFDETLTFKLSPKRSDLQFTIVLVQIMCERGLLKASVNGFVVRLFPLTFKLSPGQRCVLKSFSWAYLPLQTLLQSSSRETPLTVTLFFSSFHFQDEVMGHVQLGYGATSDTGFKQWESALQNSNAKCTEWHRITADED